MKSVGSIFAKNVITVRPGDTLSRSAERMEQHNIGALVVVEQERPVGIITDRDIAIALGARHAVKSDTVQTVMTCPVTTMHEDEGIYDATKHMMAKALRRMPVVDGAGRLVGLVTLDDLLVLLSRELDNLARGIRAEVAVPA